MSDRIDFVVTWLDPSDPRWVADYQREGRSEKYSEIADFSPSRYRDWDNFRYWFRGVEKNAPWVNKVHLITYGHIPDWLNVDHPKLNIVKHSDYIDEDFLPTFNSRVLELNLVHLADLSENFVLFNDDFFIVDSVTPEMFFRKGLPCDAAVLNAYNGEGLSAVQMNNVNLINETYRKKKVISTNLLKWFNPIYGLNLFLTLFLLPWPKFTGFKEFHLPQPYTKSNLHECWRLYSDDFLRTCKSKFRLKSDVNHYLFRYNHLVKGQFHPANPEKLGEFFIMEDSAVLEIAGFIADGKKKIVVVNDSDIEDFEAAKGRINYSLQQRLPGKSSFEV